MAKRATAFAMKALSGSAASASFPAAPMKQGILTANAYACPDIGDWRMAVAGLQKMKVPFGPRRR
jgi:hypothetical protein